ncbi:MAG TPA: hypothetical protein DCY06_12700 [Bacteroidetes bacterium]|nr:hypothetical protein [Bacteroidota bacterium]HRJ99127.1 C40 family peptidase [Ignavibacteria bacterium]
MIKSKLLKLMPVLLFIFSVTILMGCSSSRELAEDRDGSGNKKNANGNNSTEVASTSSLTEKTTINKENLEAISSSLAGFLTSSEFSGSVDKDEVMYKVIEYLNTPYLWGGTSKRGIDCSAFIQTIVYQALGVSLPRTSFEQSNVGEPVEKDELKFGDLVFFDTMRKGRVSHVGMYLGNGYFAHSGSKTGVIVASLDDDFYTRTYLKARRVTGN